MQKKRAAWFCLHASLLLAECSRHTADVNSVTQCVSGSCVLRGGCEQLTKGLNIANGRTAWLGAGKRNRNSRERAKEKKIWSSESSKLLLVWYWAVKRPLQINLLTCSRSSLLPSANAFPSPSVGSPPPLTLCSALSV